MDKNLAKLVPHREGDLWASVMVTDLLLDIADRELSKEAGRTILPRVRRQPRISGKPVRFVAATRRLSENEREVSPKRSRCADSHDKSDGEYIEVDYF